MPIRFDESRERFRRSDYSKPDGQLPADASTGWML
jgi:hypothetical protein